MYLRETHKNPQGDHQGDNWQRMAHNSQVVQNIRILEDRKWLKATDEEITIKRDTSLLLNTINISNCFFLSKRILRLQQVSENKIHNNL